MSKYILYKANEYVDVRAYIEQIPSSNNPQITFDRILNKNHAEYEPVTIRVPANLHPDVYVCGDLAITCLATDMTPPHIRLPIYSANGKRYAYVEFKENFCHNPRNHYSWEEYGHTIRARFEIKKTENTL